MVSLERKIARENPEGESQRRGESKKKIIQREGDFREENQDSDNQERERIQRRRKRGRI